MVIYCCVWMLRQYHSTYSRRRGQHVFISGDSCCRERLRTLPARLRAENEHCTLHAATPCTLLQENSAKWMHGIGIASCTPHLSLLPPALRLRWPPIAQLQPMPASPCCSGVPVRQEHAVVEPVCDHALRGATTADCRRPSAVVLRGRLHRWSASITGRQRQEHREAIVGAVEAGSAVACTWLASPTSEARRRRGCNRRRRLGLALSDQPQCGEDHDVKQTRARRWTAFLPDGV